MQKEKTKFIIDVSKEKNGGIIMETVQTEASKEFDHPEYEITLKNAKEESILNTNFLHDEELKDGNMFPSCHNMTNADLSGFDTSKVVDMEGMFRQCFPLVGYQWI